MPWRDARPKRVIQAKPMEKILVVEDDKSVADQVKRQLGRSGYCADVSNDGEAALALGQSVRYSAVVLDLGLPKLDGLSVLRQWRGLGICTPVIILTSRGSWTDRVEGINIGADDYLPKPFRFEELLARIRAILRRTDQPHRELKRIGNIIANVQRKTITRGGTVTELTALEFRLFEVLAASPGEIVKTADLLEGVYGADHHKYVNTFDRLLGRLRTKIGAGVIEVHRGLGYKLVIDP
jgi:two-component system, OmpR family, response regulator